MARQHWLIKSEPFKYPFDQLVKDRKTTWDGVRNFEARNHLRAMKQGDFCLFYHSNEGKAVVGIARVAGEAYPDPTTSEDFSAVDIEPVRPLARPVTLAEMRDDAVLGKMEIFRRQRLSVVPVSDAEFEGVVRLAGLPAPDAPPAAQRSRKAASDGKNAARASKPTRAAKKAAAPSKPARSAKKAPTAAQAKNARGGSRPSKARGARSARQA